MGFWKYILSFFRPKKPEHCPINPGVDSLLAVIEVVSKLSAMPSILAASGGNPVLALTTLALIAPAILKIATEYDDIPCELAALSADNFGILVHEIAVRYGVNEETAKTIVAEILALIRQITDVTPRVVKLVDLARGQSVA